MKGQEMRQFNPKEQEIKKELFIWPKRGRRKQILLAVRWFSPMVFASEVAPMMELINLWNAEEQNKF